MTSLPPLPLDPLPQIDLRHMFVLTDSTAMLQHAMHATPDLHYGYCTDDNARSLIAAVKAWALPEELWRPSDDLPGRSDLQIVMQRYLAFLSYAFNADLGRFRNFMQYERDWLEEVGSEDSHARTLWGLGKAVHYAPNDDVRELSRELFLRALPAVEGFHFIKPMAYALLGIHEYLQQDPEQGSAMRLNTALAERLFTVYKENATDDWPWWEDALTWGNAKLPHAMLVAGSILENNEAVAEALKALRWCLEIQTSPSGNLSIIGNRGWYWKGADKAQWAQQPIEAKALVQACLAAAMCTAEEFWTAEAVRCFEWFTGRNDLGIPLYNPETGGGQDGLEETGVNANQGAESTLAYLMSVLELHLYDHMQKGEDVHPAATL